MWHLKYNKTHDICFIEHEEKSTLRLVFSYKYFPVRLAELRNLTSQNIVFKDISVKIKDKMFLNTGNLHYLEVA